MQALTYRALGVLAVAVASLAALSAPAWAASAGSQDVISMCTFDPNGGMT